MKPPYKVPSMKEIESLPWNGYNVVSTFSGGGGSCLGYKMAGYKVVWANEFIPEAQQTYRLNHKGTYLDTRDIRQVQPEDILEATGLKVGEIDMFDGSPPCCAFSTAGSREKGWGEKRLYSGVYQRVDDLFFEYARLIRGLQPKTFVAENVSGLIKGKAKGYFKLILQELKDCGYNVEARLLNAAFLGVPQSRERLIFIGVRKDLGVKPSFPAPLKYYYTIGDALHDMPASNEKSANEIIEWEKGTRSREIVATKMPKNPPRRETGAKYMNGSYFNLARESMYQPCGTICQGGSGRGGACNYHPIEDRRFTIEELKRITSLPDDFILAGEFWHQWERCGRMVPPVMMRYISENVKTNILDRIKEA